MMTLRFNNGEGHANVKREIGLNWQNNNFARAPCFLVQYDVKVPNFTENSTPEEFAYTWQSKLVGIIAIKTEKSRIHYFHIDHNAPFLPPKILYIRCFQFPLGITVVPREIQDDRYAKLWGVNKVHYGLCANGEFTFTWRFADVTVLGKMLVNSLAKQSSSQVDTGHLPM